MRVLFVTNNFTPYSGGLVSSIQAVTRELQNQGHEVTIATLDFAGEHNDPAHVVRVPCPVTFTYKQNPMAVPFGAAAFLHDIMIRMQPDVVHVHHPFLLGPVAVRMARLLSIPVFFTHHTMYDKYVHYIPMPSVLTQPVINQMVVNFCKKVDQVIAPSRGMSEGLNTQGIGSHVIPSPLREVFCNQKLRLKKILSTKKLICVTRFAKEKNIPLLFDVLEQLPSDYHLKLIGFGDEEDALRNMVHARLLSDRVQFIIKPALDELIEFYNNEHLFLFPSTTDTQGIVLAESMACSTPVIAIDGLGQRDIIQQGENGMICFSAREMAEMIKEIMTDQEMYQRMQRNAFATAQRYTPARIIDELISCYTINAYRNR